jgi:oxalate---CoA ligase
MSHFMTAYSEKSLPPINQLWRKRSNQSALRDLSGNSCSYGELEHFVAETLVYMQGVFGDSRAQVLILLPDQPATMVLQLCLLETSTAIPLNPAQTENELRLLVNSLQPSCIVSNSDNSVAEALAAEFGLCHLILTPRIGTCGPFDLAPVNEIADIPAAIRDSDAALILPTSGSTGDPKLVPLSKEAIYSSAQNIASWLKLGPEDRAIHLLPTFHIGALVDLFLAPLLAGGSVIFVHPMTSARVYAAVVEQQATWLQLVPTMLMRLLADMDDVQLKKMGECLRFVRSVSSDLPPTTQQVAESLLGGTPLIQIYGMTESAGQIASNPLPPETRKPGSVGLPSGSEIELMDAYGNPVAPGEQGEICIKGEKVTPGYVNSDRSENYYGPWLRTGDLGRLDSDGYLELTGRLKEVVNRGGEKISLQEIDRVAQGHPRVEQAIAFALPHPSLGEEVAIAVVFKQSKSEEELDDEGSLRLYFEKQLAEHKVPRKINCIESMPLLASGKVNRRALVGLVENGSKQSQTNFSPDTPTERLVVRLWKNVLKSPVPSRETDFFDAGGDSLAATGFLVALEKALRTSLPSDFVYKNTTFAAIVRALDSESLDSYQLSLPKPLFDAIRRATAGWPGKRRSSSSLIIEHNTSGEQQPLPIPIVLECCCR